MLGTGMWTTGSNMWLLGSKSSVWSFLGPVTPEGTFALGLRVWLPGVCTPRLPSTPVQFADVYVYRPLWAGKQQAHIAQRLEEDLATS